MVNAIEKSATTNSLESTAYWTARARSHVSVQTDHMLDDPWAAALVGAEGLAWAANCSPDSPVTMPDMPRNWFVTAQKVKQ
jgi:O-methyltransferase involved in polyketide biosynthesis